MRPSAAILSRPRPPAELTAISGRDLFEPATELLDWLRSAYLDELGPLYTEEHAHLAGAKIGCLWTNVENRRRMRRIVGAAELVKNTDLQASRWKRARSLYQLAQWFGEPPDFLLTFDALACDQLDDASFCALVDHELYHCAQKCDENGAPIFYQRTGLPMFAIRGHDVEEFIGVVRRFGIEAAGSSAVELVVAAAAKPEITAASLARSCGTCLRLAA